MKIKLVQTKDFHVCRGKARLGSVVQYCPHGQWNSIASDSVGNTYWIGTGATRKEAVGAVLDWHRGNLAIARKGKKCRR